LARVSTHFLEGDIVDGVADFDDYFYDYDDDWSTWSIDKDFGSVNLAEADLRNGCCQFATSCSGTAACAQPPPPPLPPTSPPPPGPCVEARNVVEGVATDVAGTFSTDAVKIVGCVGTVLATCTNALACEACVEAAQAVVRSDASPRQVQ
jgi:hypothetical protein